MFQLLSSESQNVRVESKLPPTVAPKDLWFTGCHVMWGEEYLPSKTKCYVFTLFLCPGKSKSQKEKEREIGEREYKEINIDKLEKWTQIHTT